MVIKLVDTPSPKLLRLLQPGPFPVEGRGDDSVLRSDRLLHGVPALGYHWDFGDGTVSEGPNVSHCYTRAADFLVRLTVDGPDGAPYEQSFSIRVSGELKPTPHLRANRRFEHPADK